MRIATLAVAYLLGVALFLLVADFGSQDAPLTPMQKLWTFVWGLWQNVFYTGAFAWYCLYYYTTGVDRFRAKWVFYYSSLLAVWEILSVFTRMSVNDEWAMAVVFGLLAIVCIVIALWKVKK